MTAELFSTETCAYCKKAKDYLRSLGIQVKEKDIARNDRYLDEFRRKAGVTSGVPVIFLKGRKIIGFDKKRIDETLNICS